MVELYVVDARQVVEAADLIARFGTHAVVEATIRAGASRNRGNHVQFCRWRQTRRLIDLMISQEIVGSVH